MANSNLKSLSEIFNDKLFRIPDYQRGYSWEHQQLEDLWRDIKHLPQGKSHYTGMITVDNRDNKIYNVIDGQQRLTTLIILLKNILFLYNDEWITDDIEKEAAIKKYLYSKTKNSKNPKIIFSYEENNSSFYYYKTKILEIEDKTNKNSEKTLYTENLNYANNFFKDKLEEKASNALEELFEKITIQLKFNWYEIEKTDDLDEYVIFETMNNRGKPLSVLEILKNRLIYIVTLLDNDQEDKQKLRDDVNNVWKTIFEYLGKDKRIDEIVFLKNHSIMYFGEDFIGSEVKPYLLNDIFNVYKVHNLRNQRDKIEKIFNSLNNIETYLKELNNLKFKNIKENKNIFQNIFNESKNINRILDEKEPLIGSDFYEWDSDNDIYNESYKEGLDLITSCKEQLSWFKETIYRELQDIREDLYIRFLPYDFIEDYIASLKKSISSYYYFLNYSLTNNFKQDIKYWLAKINILDNNIFLPILFSLLNNFDNISNEQFIKVLQEMEKLLFIKNFTNQTITEKITKTNLLGYNYIKYNSFPKIDMYKPNSSTIKLFNSDKFIKFITKQFDYNEGYYSWSGLKYTLYEYEISLQQKYHGETKILWQDINNDSIEHIYPQTPKGTWIDDFNNLKNEDQKKKYRNSIGNLLLLSHKKNSTASNKPFREKKEIYSTGSFSAIEVSKYDQWTTKEIDERSEVILNFMNKRWNLGLKIADINKLL